MTQDGTRKTPPIHEPVLAWLRSFKDPFRNVNVAAQWISAR